MVRPDAVVAPLLTAGIAVGLAACGDTDPGPSDATVAITSPADGSTVGKSTLTVRGTAEGASEIEVGDETVDVVGGKWNVKQTFAEGEVSVVARAEGASDRVDFTVDSHAPTLTLTSPERGRYIEADGSSEVVVRGEVADGGTGVRVVSVNGNVVDVGGDGRFEYTAAVDEGLNVLEVEALDEADNRATALRGVMVGQFASPTERIEPGIHMRIGPGALATAEQVIEGFFTPERVTMFARDNVESDKFDFEVIDYETLEVELEPQSESETIRTTVAIEGLSVDGVGHFGGDDFPLTVTVDAMSVRVDLSMAVDENNALVFDLTNSAVTLDPEDFHFSLRDESGNPEEVDEEALRQAAVNIIKRSFANLIDGELLNQLWDPAVLRREVDILDRQIVFEVVPLGIDIRCNRIHLRAAFEMPVDRHEAVPTVPGALNRELGDWNLAEIESDLKARTNRTAVERIGHGVWRAGLLHQTLRSDDFAGRELPIDLNAGALAFAVDGRITNLADDDTPAAVRLRPMLPPVVAFRGPGEAEGEDGADAHAGMRLGEFAVDLLLLPDDGDPITVATVALFLDLDVGITLDGFTLQFNFETDLRADLMAEPEIDFRDHEMEALVAGLGEAIPLVLGDEMTISGRDDLTWVQLENPRVQVRGDKDDRTSMFLDVKPGDLSGLEASDGE